MIIEAEDEIIDGENEMLEGQEQACMATDLIESHFTHMELPLFSLCVYFTSENYEAVWDNRFYQSGINDGH